MSRPNQVRIMLVLAFMLTLIAGAVVGAGLARSGQEATVQPPPPSHGGNGAVSPAPLPGTNPSTNPSARHDRNNWFADRLSLNTQQQEEWNKIWRNSPRDRFKVIFEQERACYQQRDEEVKALYNTDQLSDRDRINQEYWSKVGEFKRERDKSIAALYTPEQKAERERLEKECEKKVADLRQERETLLKPMVDKSRLILTEEQRKRFDQMLHTPGPGNMGQGSQLGAGDRGHRNSQGGTGRHGPSTQPSTRPSASPPTAPSGDAK